MGISLKPEHLKRYKDIAWLLMKYGRGDLVKQVGLDEALAGEDAEQANEIPSEAKALADDLERMGPTFIKLGQLFSTRPDILPFAYMEALARLQDNVESFSFADVEKTVTNELGVRISRAFSEFEATPMAAASLGQVHRARLRNGRAVAVKVQRPDIREDLIKDLEALESVAELLDNNTDMGRHYQFQQLLDEFRKSLLRELDYREEARNLLTMAENLKEFDRIVVPRPIEDYTTSRVLTMEYVEGQKVTSLSPVARLDLNGAELAEQLFRAYLKQILVDGFFHADPHPGNVFLTSDNRIALLDLGMVARITPGLQDRLLRLLLSISEGRGEEAATLAIDVAEAREQFDEAEFRRRITDLVSRYQSANMQQIEIGTIVLELTQVSTHCGIRLPPELAMLGKTLLNLDQVGRTLDPEFDPNASIRRNSASIMQQRMFKSLSPGNVFSSALEMKDFVERLPTRVNKILDAVANNEIQIRVDAIDETHLMEGFQKLANRITLGLILAAMIVGAAMLMRVETPFKILGYPGLAILFFLIAAGGGVALVISILFTDEKSRKP